MRILILETKSQKLVDAELLPTRKMDMKGISDGWKFSWKKHFSLPYSKAYKVVIKSNIDEIQGLLIYRRQRTLSGFSRFSMHG
jgi:hypothetical protein